MKNENLLEELGTLNYKHNTTNPDKLDYDGTGLVGELITLIEELDDVSYNLGYLKDNGTDGFMMDECYLAIYKKK